MSQGGHHLVERKSLLSYYGMEEENNEQEKIGRNVAIYIRVSSNAQKRRGSLARQQERVLRQVAEKEEMKENDIRIFKDVGSAFSERNGLNQLVLAITRGELRRIYVEVRDRISRTPGLMSVLNWVCHSYNARIIYLEKEDHDEETIEDGVKEILEFFVVVNNKLAGRRSARVTTVYVSPDVLTQLKTWHDEGIPMTDIVKRAGEIGLRATDGRKLTYHLCKKFLLGRNSDALNAVLPSVNKHNSFILFHSKYIKKIPPRLDARTGKAHKSTRLLKKDLYAQYEKFCEQKNLGRPLTANQVGRIMKRQFGCKTVLNRDALTTYVELKLVGVDGLEEKK